MIKFFFILFLFPLAVKAQCISIYLTDGFDSTSAVYIKTANSEQKINVETDQSISLAYSFDYCIKDKSDYLFISYNASDVFLRYVDTKNLGLTGELCFIIKYINCALICEFVEGRPSFD